MRIAVLMLGLILGAIMFFQTFLVYSLSGLANDSASGESGAVGLFMALLWLVACALVIAVPLVSAVIFVVAGLLGFTASTNFSDLQLWGGVSLILAVLSLIGWFGKRRGERREALRHAELVTSIHRTPATYDPAFVVDQGPGPQPLPPNVPADIPCPSCGSLNRQGVKYCAECGLAQTPATI